RELCSAAGQQQHQTVPSNCTYHVQAHPSRLFCDHRLFERVHTLILNCSITSCTASDAFELDLVHLPSLSTLEMHGSCFSLKRQQLLLSVKHLYLEYYRSDILCCLPSLTTLTINTFTAEPDIAAAV